MIRSAQQLHLWWSLLAPTVLNFSSWLLNQFPNGSLVSIMSSMTCRIPFLWKNLTIMLIYFYSINCNWFLICVLQNWAVVTDKSSRKHPQIRKFLFVSSFTGTICRTNLTAIADFPQPPGPIRAIFSFLKQNSSFWSFMIINKYIFSTYQVFFQRSSGW